MGYPNRKAVVFVPASKVAAFNTIMERQGYGANWLKPSADNAVVGKDDDAKVKAATHYVVEASGDSGLAAAIAKALGKVNDKLPAKEKGVVEAGFAKSMDKAKSEKILIDAGLKQKTEKQEDTKPVDGLPVDDGGKKK
jgi:hypothetical protein